LRTVWVPAAIKAPVAALRMPVGVVGWGGDPSRPISLARRIASAARYGRLETVGSLGELTRDPHVYARLIQKLLTVE